MLTLTELIPRNYYVYIAVFMGHLGIFISAISMTWPSPILWKLSQMEDNPLKRIITPTEKSILGSVPIVGGLIGTIYSGCLAKKYGRKPTMTMLIIPTIISYVIMVFANKIWELYIARILGGFTLGGIFTVNTMYFAEVAENSNRGFLGTAMTCFINFGLLFPLVLGPLTNFFWFHVVLSILPLFFVILIYLFLPESPYYLVQNNFDEAEIVLQKLRGNKDVLKELNDIKEFIETETNIGLKDVFHNEGFRKGLIIGGGLILFQQLSGTAVIMSYGQQVFADSGNGIPSELGPIILASLQFLVGFVTPVLIDRVGRKILLMISYIGITFAYSLFGIKFFLESSSFSWLPLASLILYIITYSLGSGPIPWTIIGEIFPHEVKSAATSVCIIICNTAAFILLISYNDIKNFIGIGTVFWIFSGCGVLATNFVKFYVIETKGKSLKQIQEELNKSS